MTTLAEIKRRMSNYLTDSEHEYLHDLEAELKLLRGIEAAVLNGQTRVEAAIRFRAVAREFLLLKDRVPLFAIADALEKPK